MKLLDAWKRVAFDPQGQGVKHVWDEYLVREKAFYANFLRQKQQRIEGIVSELATEFGFSNIQMCAFLDGISECVDGLPDLNELEETHEVGFDVDHERLFRQMVEYKAEPLYTLPQWDEIFSKEEQKRLYTDQKRSHTVVRNESKVGRNDACPCGSGKKYKKCCAQSA